MSVSLSARDLIASSLRLIGALAQGETADANDEKDAFATLNQLIDEWETQHLTALATTRHVDDLVADQASYTIGPSGDFDHPRPVDIASIALLRTALTPNQETPLTKFTYAMWQAIPDKDQTGTEPFAFYYEPTDPDGTIYLYPVPDNATNDLAIYVTTALTQFDDRDSQVTLPPAYAKALRFNLAVDLIPEFAPKEGGADLADIKRIAAESLGNLKRQNVRMVDLALPCGMGGDGGVYDIFSDH